MFRRKLKEFTLLHVFQEDDGVLVVRFRDQKFLDDEHVHRVGAEMTEVSNLSEGQKVVVNLSDVRFLSIAAIGTLVRWRKLTIQRSGRMNFCHVGPNLGEVFQITMLDLVFEILETETQALESIRKVSKPSSQGRMRW